jgi:hypothetical protein
MSPGEAIVPSQSVTITYAGFLDRSLEAGTYRVRYFSPYPSLGGSRDDPLTSEWVPFTVRAMNEFPSVPPLKPAALRVRKRAARRSFWTDWWHRIVCHFRRLWARIFGHPWCDRILSREVDEACTEIISDAPLENEEKNGTYSWRARFLVTLDQANCRVTVTMRIRIYENTTVAQRTAWKQAIETAWSNHFKFCCHCCCCLNGYTVVADVQFVTSGEHQVVVAGESTMSMTNWGVDDTVDVRHEFGHMLGALDEYFTINGVDYGEGRQPNGNIMNNPANLPAAHHYDLVKEAVQQLLESDCRTRAVSQQC